MEISNINWKSFEKITKFTLKKMDFEIIEESPTGKDNGVDLIVQKDDKIRLVSVKKLRNKVTSSIIKEIFATAISRKIKYAIVVSFSGFTEPAIIFAKENNILLLSLDEIMTIMVSSHKNYFGEQKDELF